LANILKARSFSRRSSLVAFWQRKGFGTHSGKVNRNGGFNRSENSAGIVLANSDNRNVDSTADVLEGWNFYDVTCSNLLERPAAAKRAGVPAPWFDAGSDSRGCTFLDTVCLCVLRKLSVPKREAGGGALNE
jgi:hypothetical protein